MTHHYKYLLALALVPFFQTAKAQTITFDTDDYKSISVYDSWADSPLNDGTIQPAVAVIPNHLTEPAAETGLHTVTPAYFVGVQLSRYGSNIAALRVDLKESFRLNKTGKYVHVMVNRPVNDSRLMLITLGKRSERYGQSTDVEQTWTLCSTSADANQWFDAVFEIKGFSYDDTEQNGIDIYSLVICPDVANRGDLDKDFVCYIDQIEVSDDVAPRFSSSLYAINFDAATANTRTDRCLNSVSFSVYGESAQKWNTDTGLIYNNGVEQGVIFTTPVGKRISAIVDYTGTWMGACAYIDWGQDGQFSYDVQDNGKPATGSDLVTYIGMYVNDVWRSSNGSNVGDGNQVQNSMPSFYITSTATPGLYRMRYKVDWETLDPAGNSSGENNIVSNGGAIADVMVNVQGTQITVSASQLNGDVIASTGEALNGYKVTRGDELRIVMQPAPGFTHNGIKVKYGYNLDGDSVVNDNPQYFTTTIPASAFTDDELTLPDSIMAYGEVSIEGLMVQAPTAVSSVDAEEGAEQPFLYDLEGRATEGKNKGIYIQKGHKFVKH